MKNRSFPSSILSELRRLFGSEHMVMTILALIIGSLVGCAVVALREVISLIQTAFYGSGSDTLFANADSLHWWQILFVPVIGGLIVGLLAHYLMPNKRPESMADVIEASALRGGRMSPKTGLLAAIISAVSIGAGASVGREGPAVHLGASLAGWMGRRLGLSRSMTRTLLAGGVAAAVAASFNAPIAGVLFASEVIVGHYALNAFAPIVIASVAGTAVARIWFGDFPAFMIQKHYIASFWEFPAFAGLGLIAGVVAIAFMWSIFQAQRLGKEIPAPAWLKPAIAGLAIGLIGLVFPEVLGVGYGVTEGALFQKISLVMLLAFAVAKIAATAVSIGWGFGGGVFSPSLVIGAMIGGAYGIIVTGISPDYSSGAAAYTLVGMAAMAAAVLGAPISTTLIMFEMTGDYAVTLGVMVAVVIATEITQQFYGRSFFAEQLHRRGIDLKGGFEAEILKTVKIGDVVQAEPQHIPLSADLPEIRKRLQESKTGEVYVVRDNGELYGSVTLADMSETAFDAAIDDLLRAGDIARTDVAFLSATDDLETALDLLSESGDDRIAIVDSADGMIFEGSVNHADVMTAYNRALLKSRHEEHGH